MLGNSISRSHRPISPRSVNHSLEQQSASPEVLSSSDSSLSSTQSSISSIDLDNSPTRSTRQARYGARLQGRVNDADLADLITKRCRICDTLILCEEGQKKAQCPNGQCQKRYQCLVTPCDRNYGHYTSLDRHIRQCHYHNPELCQCGAVKSENRVNGRNQCSVCMLYWCTYENCDTCFQQEIKCLQHIRRHNR